MLKAETKKKEESESSWSYKKDKTPPKKVEKKEEPKKEEEADEYDDYYDEEYYGNEGYCDWNKHPEKHPLYKTEMCHNIPKFGKCTYPNCRFAHSKSELRKPNKQHLYA